MINAEGRGGGGCFASAGMGLQHVRAVLSAVAVQRGKMSIRTAWRGTAATGGGGGEPAQASFPGTRRLPLRRTDALRSEWAHLLLQPGPEGTIVAAWPRPYCSMGSYHIAGGLACSAATANCVHVCACHISLTGMCKGGGAEGARGADGCSSSFDTTFQAGTSVPLQQLGGGAGCCPPLRRGSHACMALARGPLAFAGSS